MHKGSWAFSLITHKSTRSQAIQNMHLNLINIHNYYYSFNKNGLMVTMCNVAHLLHVDANNKLFTFPVTDTTVCFSLGKYIYLYCQLPLNGHLVKADTSLKQTRGVGPFHTPVIYFIFLKGGHLSKMDSRAGPESVHLRGSCRTVPLFLVMFLPP